MNEIEREIDYLLGWYQIKRKYMTGLVLTAIGIIVLIIKLILLQNFFPNYIYHHHDIIIYNGPLIRLYIGIIMGCIGIFFMLIGLPYFIINSKKKKNLYYG